MFTVLLRGLAAVAGLRSVADDLRSAYLRERVLLAATSLLLHDVCDMGHLSVVRGRTLNELIDVVLQVLIVSTTSHCQGIVVALAARRVILRPDGSRVLAPPHLLEALLRIVHSREQRLVPLSFEM